MTPDVPRQDQLLNFQLANDQRILNQMAEIVPVFIFPDASREELLNACVALGNLNRQLMNFAQHRAFAIGYEEMLDRMMARLERTIAEAD
ncbi:hypothetical protein GCK72_022618 [Caenorhabditis remanei]|uniref:Uncharacterized protein n=1 Tax=Caenorhabditis remanei TaxID=31234 RepID=A0A6A5FUH6_CAERE|nr:hypothetical protein GCK72_022618 [Caenorhabditis remanei]KAF1746165.1 hypothetical protein GCK72_022618 [Caenorhabditis remanei]